ncbi:uncharacterized protein LOC110897445 [Helianthus annuus]|nr:uncharacterized protein LOC110897445 [Helianthus annuus]
MDLQKNPNLDTTHNQHHHVLPSPSSSSQDFKTNHHQHNIHSSKKTHEDEGFIFKNPNSLSCPSLVGREEYMPPPPPPSLQDIKKAHHGHNIHVSNKTNIGKEGFTFKNPNSEVIKKPNLVSCSLRPDGKGHMTTPPPSVPEVEESGRDRLKRHRVEMAGRVWIPDTWGHEDFLKDWIDCTVFDSSLGNNTIMSARAALIQEGRSKVRIENKC